MAAYTLPDRRSGERRARRSTALAVGGPQHGRPLAASTAREWGYSSSVVATDHGVSLLVGDGEAWPAPVPDERYVVWLHNALLAAPRDVTRAFILDAALAAAGTPTPTPDLGPYPLPGGE